MLGQSPWNSKRLHGLNRGTLKLFVIELLKNSSAAKKFHRTIFIFSTSIDHELEGETPPSNHKQLR
jgi:hypothetical protein